jgi:S-DNA-T family DNA segregation ATPase FtsK/SpoIIIE
LEGLGRILLKVVSGAFALVMAVALLSFSPLDPHLLATGAVTASVHNWCGTFGAHLAGLFMAILGHGAWLLPAYMLWELIPAEGPRWHRRLAWLALAFAVVTALGAFPPRQISAGEGVPPIPVRWGGAFGSSLWPPLVRTLGPVGLPIALGVLALLSGLVLAPALIQALGRLLVRFFGEKAWPWLKPLPAKGVRGLLQAARRPFLGWRSRSSELADLDAVDAQELQSLADQQRAMHEQHQALLRAERDTADFRRAHRDIPADLAFPVIHSMRLPDVLDADLHPSDIIDAEPLDGEHLAKAEMPAPALLRDLPPPKPTLVKPRVTTDRYGRVAEQPPLPLTEPTPNRELPSLKLPPSQPVPEVDGPEEAVAERLELPPRRLFDPPSPHERVDPAVLEATREQIGKKLAEFKVKGAVVGMQPGPVVTIYEFAPDAGIPLAKVLGMEEDLALALQAEAVRIDRIPGRNLVGIEVPNPSREVITFREILDAPAFRDPHHRDGGSLLTLALGKDIAGVPVVADLAKMPHLLIGGSTGSGKSVGVNAMICSVLVRALPSEVKLILVDPKMVELGIYEDIPHLWAPVVTDMKEAGRVLKWVVAQMEDRYRRLALLAVRNLEQFNAKVREQGGVIDLASRTPNPRWPDRPAALEPLPYVVVVIDELADLMMVARSEVEDSIARIAQKARAVGIHLILATQRPSVDIVTGVIKANLPSRLSYRVNTKIDSRTILDTSGGEQLLGRGDALYKGPTDPRPRRIHAPFLTEAETLRLVQWLKERGRPEFNAHLLSAMETDEEAGGAEGEEPGGADEDVYSRAVAVVRRERKASTSLLQRKLNLGYGRAARLIDRMEEEGIIGPDRGAGKPREVLVEE